MLAAEQIAAAFVQTLFGFFQPSAEVEPFKLHRQLRPARRLAVQAVQAFGQFAVQIQIGFDGDELVRQRQLRQRGLQVFAYLTFDFTSVLNYTRQRAVLFQPFHRGFGAAFFHARHVINLIAHQREVVDNLIRMHAEFVFYPFDIQLLVAHGVHQRHLLAHQLRHVFIAGGNHHLPALGLALLGERADYVVGLHIGYHQHRPTHQAHQFRQHLGLRTQFIRHRRAGGFVVGIHFVAEVFAFGVEHHRAMAVHIIGAQAAQHIEHAGEIKGKVGENLQAALPQLPLSYQLVTIKTDLDLHGELPEGLHSLHRKSPRWPQLAVEFKRLNFRTWLKEAEERLHEGNGDLFGSEHIGEQAALAAQQPSAPEIRTAAAPAELNYQAVTTETQFAELLAKLERAEAIGIDTETTSLNPLEARLVGISIAFAAGEAVYIPLGHSPTAAPEQLDLPATLGRLKLYLENACLKKIGQNLKYDQHIFANYGIALNGIAGDAMLASYIIESHLGHGLDELAERWLGLPTITYESLCGKGAKQISFADVALDQATEYAAQDADFALRIESWLKQQMDAKQLEMYENMELPVAQVLFEMERNGVLIDKDELARQSHELGSELLQLEQQAYQIAGQPFNLNSPKQLQEILFDKMDIPTKGLKKTASGGISTNEAVLETLAPDYPLPKIILQNRGLAKLKSTYTDKLPEMINPQTGRVHTTYAQAVAITGRLASNNPNLQNIPIRTEEGRRVRRAFVAPEGSRIVSADYSQIELRIMAHLSGDKTLLEAFKNGEDVHRRTAAEVFGVAPESVSPEQRRYAKTINFGLIYGMGQYGLAKSLGIDNLSAKNFIDRYFARYPGVAEYMQRTKEQAAAQGYVETLFGRRLHLPDIRAGNANQRAGAERAAINAPMQGTASDLIKRAMIAVSHWLASPQGLPSGAERLQSKLVMQVHDELVLEVVESEMDLVKQKLPELMAGVAEGELAVPLVAEVGVGGNWEEAH